MWMLVSRRRVVEWENWENHKAPNQTAFLVKVKVQASMEFVFACVAICNSVGVLSKSRQQLALKHFR